MLSGAGRRWLEQRVEHLVPGLGDLLRFLHPADLLGQVGAQLVDGVELAGQLGEVVVDVGQRPLVDRR